MNTAIVVAAGSGTRFGGRPKQFFLVHGKPLVIHTLERFENCPSIDEIILVLPSGDTAGFNPSTYYSPQKLSQIVAGGRSRAESVKNGLSAIDDRCRIVAVHDGARPLVSTGEIDEVVSKADDHGAACLVANVSDTIKEVKDDRVIRTVDRLNLRRALTPQAFRVEILRRAYETDDLDEAVTDDCLLVERLGIEIAVVDGSPRNIKITTPEDIHILEALLGNKYVQDRPRQ